MKIILWRIPGLAPRIRHPAWHSTITHSPSYFSADVARIAAAVWCSPSRR